VDIARSVGDPVLLSVALDAQGAAAENAGQLREAHRIGLERLALLPALSRDDPHAGSEIFDILYMAPRAAIGMGALAAALAAARMASAEDLVGHHAALSAGLQILPLVLMGELADALRRSTTAWEV